MPGQEEKKPTMKEDNTQIQDEIELDHMNTLQSKEVQLLLNIMKITLDSFYKSPIDYEAFLKAIEEEEEYIQTDREERDATSERKSTSDRSDDESDSTMPRSYYTSQSGESTSSTIEDSEDDTPRPPNNSPVDNDRRSPRLNYEQATRTLNEVIENIRNFNVTHPTYPARTQSQDNDALRRSQRNVPRPISYRWEAWEKSRRRL